jgi:hypothetical protein
MMSGINYAGRHKLDRDPGARNPAFMLKESLKAMTTPLARALLRFHPISDAWSRFEHVVPVEIYGEGSCMDFDWYLEGKSSFCIESVDDLIDWLLGCSYVPDADLFQIRDYWQHPCTFEQLRSGDCEDFSLWAWRKLIEMQVDVEFVAGRVRSLRQGGNWTRGHTWVHLDLFGERYVLDAVMKERPVILRPLASVLDEYLPEVSVDHDLRTYVYGGYYMLRNGMESV